MERCGEAVCMGHQHGTTKEELAHREACGNFHRHGTPSAVGLGQVLVGGLGLLFVGQIAS